MASIKRIVLNVVESTIVLAGMTYLAYILKTEPAILYACALGYYVTAARGNK